MKKSTFSLVMFNFCVIVILGFQFFRVSILNEKLKKQNINIEKNEKKYNELVKKFELLETNFEKFKVVSSNDIKFLKEKNVYNLETQEKVDDFILDRIYNLEGLDNNYCKKYEK